MASAMTHPVAPALAPAPPCSSPFRIQEEARADNPVVPHRVGRARWSSTVYSRILVAYLVTS
jgi:hypothetical protein